MRMRRGPMFGAVALLGAAVAVLPAMAGSETIPSITAYSYSSGSETIRYWSPNAATVGEGGVVKISNPYAETKHGLQFTGGTAGAKPNCTGLPTAATEATGEVSWHAECTFGKPGTYTFVCTVHPEAMKGTITVNPAGTTTTTTTATPPPGGTTTTTGTQPTATQPGLGTPGGQLLSPLVGSVNTAVKLAAGPHGSSVQGSVDVSRAGVGGRLEVDLLARRAALASAARAQTRIGRLVRSSLSAGVVHFTVALNARAKRALRSHRRFALTVAVTLTPVRGSAVRTRRSLVLHR